MMSLERFNVLKIKTSKKIVGGADPNVTAGGAQTYTNSITGKSFAKVWTSDYDGVNGMEYCNIRIEPLN